MLQKSNEREKDDIIYSHEVFIRDLVAKCRSDITDAEEELRKVSRNTKRLSDWLIFRKCKKKRRKQLKKQKRNNGAVCVGRRPIYAAAGIRPTVISNANSKFFIFETFFEF